MGDDARIVKSKYDGRENSQYDEDKGKHLFNFQKYHLLLKAQETSEESQKNFLLLLFYSQNLGFVNIFIQFCEIFAKVF